MQILLRTISFLLLLCSATTQAQEASRTFVIDSIAPIELSISTTKTTTLVFPFSITTVDRGVGDLLAVKAKGIDHVLLIKAASVDLPETSLSVLTSDGVLYAFIVRYATQPSLLNARLFPPPQALRTGLRHSGGQDSTVTDAGERKANLCSALIQPDYRWGMTDRHAKMRLRVSGIYVRNDLIYLRIHLRNRSPIDFDAALFRIYLKDNRQGKRTASQEVDLTALDTIGNLQHVRANSEKEVVIAVPKFTIPDQKKCWIQLMEKNGGRHLEVKIRNPHLIRARALDTSIQP